MYVSCFYHYLLSFCIFGFDLSDDCRLLQFKPQTKNKTLQNHVIREFKVADQSKCELSCYHEPNCVSYNYGPEGGISSTKSCELSDRSHLQVSSEDFVSKENFTYREVSVRNTTVSLNKQRQQSYYMGPFKDDQEKLLKFQFTSNPPDLHLFSVDFLATLFNDPIWRRTCPSPNLRTFSLLITPKSLFPKD